MEARLLKNSSNNNNCDYLLVNLDDQSFSYLNDGNPVRVAFFVDDNKDLPWHERKCMVAMIGKNLDFNRYKNLSNEAFRKGLVDKSYLIDYINKMKKKLVQIALQDLETFDPSDSPESIQAETETEPERLTTVEAAESLNISKRSLLNLAKKRKIKGKLDSTDGYSFLKLDIEKVLKQKPRFITKIWNDHKSIRSQQGSESQHLIKKGGE